MRRDDACVVYDLREPRGPAKPAGPPGLDDIVSRCRKRPGHEPAVLEKEVARMLADPRARALATDFAAQWLRVDTLALASEPDRNRYPTYTDELRDAMIEEPQAFWNKLRGAYTDPQRLRRSDPGRPEICNIYTMHKALSTPAEVELTYQECTTAQRGCIDCKKILMDNFERELVPLRAKRAEIAADPARTREALADGASRARRIAESTMREVRAGHAFLHVVEGEAEANSTPLAVGESLWLRGAAEGDRLDVDVAGAALLALIF